MPFLLNYIWREIGIAAAEWVRPVIATMHPLLRETEISKFYMTLIVYNHIIWLEVAVQDILVVEFFESK